MMVRDSTHTRTSLTLNNYYPGFTLPIMECSSGKAYMAFCSDAERESLLEGLRTIEGAAERMAMLLLSNDSLLREVRSFGYATQSRNAYVGIDRTSKFAFVQLVAKANRVTRPCTITAGPPRSFRPGPGPISCPARSAICTAQSPGQPGAPTFAASTPRPAHAGWKRRWKARNAWRSKCWGAREPAPISPSTHLLSVNRAVKHT